MNAVGHVSYPVRDFTTNENGTSPLTLLQLDNAIQSGSYFCGNEITTGRSRRFDLPNGRSVRIVEQGKHSFKALEENKTADGRIEFTPATTAVALWGIADVARHLKKVAARPDHANVAVQLREEDDVPQDRPVKLSREKLATLDV